MSIAELVRDVEEEAAYRAAGSIYRLAQMMGRLPNISEMARFFRDEADAIWQREMSKFERR